MDTAMSSNWSGPTPSCAGIDAWSRPSSIPRALPADRDGELEHARYIIHDGDTKCLPFDATLPESIKPVKLPRRSPNLNAFAERFVLSLKKECLDYFILLSVRQLRHVIREYLAHYHAERAHQGLAGELLHPEERWRPSATSCAASVSAACSAITTGHLPDRWLSLPTCCPPSRQRFRTP